MIDGDPAIASDGSSLEIVARGCYVCVGWDHKLTALMSFSWLCLTKGFKIDPYAEDDEDDDGDGESHLRINMIL